MQTTPGIAVPHQINHFPAGNRLVEPRPQMFEQTAFDLRQVNFGAPYADGMRIEVDASVANNELAYVAQLDAPGGGVSHPPGSCWNHAEAFSSHAHTRPWNLKRGV